MNQNVKSVDSYLNENLLFAVTGAVVNSTSGAIEPTKPRIYVTKNDAQQQLDSVYRMTLANMNLEDNNACDENGNSICGGYIQEGEAVIYNYAGEFGALTEVAAFIISEVTLPMKNAEAENE